MYEALKLPRTMRMSYKGHWSNIVLSLALNISSVLHISTVDVATRNIKPKVCFSLTFVMCSSAGNLYNEWVLLTGNVYSYPH